MARAVALAVDLGASGGRIVSGAFDGRLLELKELHRFENGPVSFGGHLVWDFVGLWSGVLDGLRVAADQHQKAIQSIGVDTWGVDFSFISKNDALLSEPVCYRDARTRGLIEAAQAIVSKEETFNATGLQFIEINTLYQLLALKRDRPEILEAADQLLMIPDIMHWLLSGQRSNERTIASTTQCFNPQSGQWANDLLTRFGLPLDLFRPVFEPGHDIGSIRPDIASDAGLGDVRVLLPGSHDTASAVAAVPALEPPSSRPDWCYISLGTWALVGAELDRPLVTPECLARNFTNEGGVGGTTRLLKNLCGLWLVQQCRASWQRSGKKWNWDQLTALAAESKPLQTIIDSGHPSLVAPNDMPQAIRELAQQSNEPVPSSTGAVVRTALESVAADVSQTLQELDGLIGRRMSRVHIVGGGVQNKLLCQMIADASDRPVVAGPVEATAIGNLLVQIFAENGKLDLRSVRSVVRDSFDPITYEPQSVAAWKERLSQCAGR